MDIWKDSRIVGEFRGWAAGAIYQLADGSRWLQVRFEHKPKVRMGPKAKIWREKAKYMLEVDGMDGMVEVRRVD